MLSKWVYLRLCFEFLKGTDLRCALGWQQHIISVNTLSFGTRVAQHAIAIMWLAQHSRYHGLDDAGGVPQPGFDTILERYEQTYQSQALISARAATEVTTNEG
jgi:hypothetical protein